MKTQDSSINTLSALIGLVAIWIIGGAFSNINRGLIAIIAFGIPWYMRLLIAPIAIIVFLSTLTYVINLIRRSID